MSITIDSNYKLKLFATYMGQIALYVGPGKPFRGTEVRQEITAETLNLMCFSNDRSLELKKLENITDGHILMVAKACDQIVFENATVEKLTIERRHKVIEVSLKDADDHTGSLFIDTEDGNCACIVLWEGSDSNNPIFAHQMLVWLGYAVPYMGISVQELVEKKLVVLK